MFARCLASSRLGCLWIRRQPIRTDLAFVFMCLFLLLFIAANASSEGLVAFLDPQAQ